MTIPTDPQQAIPYFVNLLQSTTDDSKKETCLLSLGNIYQQTNQPNQIADLLRSCRTHIATLTKAKTAKVIRSLVDTFSLIPNSVPLQIAVVEESIQWAIQDKRIFLQQNLETRLVALLLENKEYPRALTLVAELLRELKRLDDKLVLVEVLLLESRAYHLLKNMAKSRASLTGARTTANAIYCPPLLQAALDMQSGILHADEKDYKTAYSYLFEALEGYASQEDPKAVLALKYMLLSKIMCNEPQDVNSIVNGKIAAKYKGRDVDGMKAVAKAYQNRSLKEFEIALSDYKQELASDLIIKTHFSELYDTLLEQNLLRVIEPYSCVEIDHVAKLVQLPSLEVEKKLSQMILDHNLNGILDQGNGHLIVYEEDKPSRTYGYALDTIKSMEKVVENLYEKAAKLAA